MIGPDLLERAIQAGKGVQVSPDLQAEIDAAARWPVSDEVRAWRAEEDRIARGAGFANASDRQRQRSHEYEMRWNENEDMRKKNEQRAQNFGR